MMFGMIFTAMISMGLPFLLFVYAYKQKYMMPFILGSAAFVVSQIFLRMPLLQYIGETYPAYTMLSMTNPIVFALIIGLSAGLFEELARYIFMVLWMKTRDFRAGFLFGAGHGGIEAVLIVGLPVLGFLFSPTLIESSYLTFVGGLERIFAMILHIGFSVLVLQGIVQKRFFYVLLAIVLHGFVDALIIIVPLFVPQNSALFVLEGAFALIAFLLLLYSLSVKRKGIL